MVFIAITEFLKKDHVKLTLDIMRIISLVSLIITVLGFFFFVIGYSFLYGYYLSGDKPGYYSILSIITNPIPFNYYTVLAISALVLLGIIFVVSAFFVFKRRKWPEVLAGSILFAIFHVCLSLFFVSGSDTQEKIVKFLIIWVVPVFVSIMIFWSLRTSLRFWTSMASSIYGMWVTLYLWHVFSIPDIYMQIFLPLVLFVAGLAATWTKRQWASLYVVRVLIILPYTSIVVLLLSLLIPKPGPSEINIYLYVIVCILISSVLALIKPKKILEEVQKIDTKEDYLKSIDKVSKASLLTVTTITVVVLGIFTPYLSLTGGQYIREFTGNENRKMEIIREFDGKVLIRGNVLSVKDGIYFISDENWELAIIKGDKIVVESMPKK